VESCSEKHEERHRNHQESQGKENNEEDRPQAPHKTKPDGYHRGSVTDGFMRLTFGAFWVLLLHNEGVKKYFCAPKSGAY